MEETVNRQEVDEKGDFDRDMVDITQTIAFPINIGTVETTSPRPSPNARGARRGGRKTDQGRCGSRPYRKYEVCAHVNMNCHIILNPK
jgi:hypothetical protein